MIGRDDGEIHRAAERFKPINYLREVAVLGSNLARSTDWWR